MRRPRLLGQPNRIVKQLALVMGWLSLLLVMTDIGPTQLGGPSASGETTPETQRCVTITIMPASLTLTVCALHQMPVSASGQQPQADRPDR